MAKYIFALLLVALIAVTVMAFPTEEEEEIDEKFFAYNGPTFFPRPTAAPATATNTTGATIQWVPLGSLLFG